MRSSIATAWNLIPFSTFAFAENCFNKIASQLCFFLLLLGPVIGQNNFDNKDFEYSSSCDPIECNDVEISCIDGWWAYGDSNPNLFAWYGYSCSHMASVYECAALGQRGIWLQEGDFGDNRNAMTVVTRNPAYLDNPNAVYKIALDFIPFTSSPPGINTSVKVSGLNSMASGVLTHLKTTTGIITDCSNITQTLFFDHGPANNPSPNITSFPYLAFSVARTPGMSPPDGSINGDLRGVMDNLSMCKVLEVIVQEDCDPLCVSVRFDEECYPNPCHLQDCNTTLLAFKENSTFIEYYNSGPWEDILACAEIPTAISTFDILFHASNEDMPTGFNIRFSHTLSECFNFDVTSNTTWNALTVPNGGRFQTLTIKSGKKLIIDEDLTLNFCQEGVLIIETGAQLELHGKLTSNCSNGWLGVKVYGNKNYNQFPDPITHSYHQGRMLLYENSVVENALVGVQLFGPTTDDTGGQIFANGASFINNSKGLQFYPYRNYALFNGVQSKNRPYESTIFNCTFKTDNNYILSVPFYTHIQLVGIDGLPILGSDFFQKRSLPNAQNVYAFGTGISALGAGFHLDDISCISPCEPDRSTFSGFFEAIYAARIFENKPYIVNHAVFSNNYFGIVNSFVSGATLTNNSFNFGVVLNDQVMNDQIGIHLRSDMLPFAFNIQENSFTRNGGSIDNTLGIVAENLGTENMNIRRNSFNGVSIGNEAFGINANNASFPTSGLHYLCNSNISGRNKDFYIPEESIYEHNNIRKDQKDILLDGPISADEAAGNTFSQTGDIYDGDFANYGIDNINYFYYAPGIYEEPIDFSGFNLKVQSPMNACSNMVCPPYCNSLVDLNDLKFLYFDNKELYEYSINLGDSLSAFIYKIRQDFNLSNILLLTHKDTSTVNIRDSLRNWLILSESYVGDLLLAGDYMQTDEFELLDSLLASISNRHILANYQVEDINRVKTLYNLLYSKSIFDLDSFTISNIHSIASGLGASSCLARGLLTLYDINYKPTYYTASEIAPRSQNNIDDGQLNNNIIIIFPNPASTNLNIEVNESIESDVSFSLFSILGEEVLTRSLSLGSNSIILDDVSSGSFHYVVTSKKEILAQGVFVKME